MFYTDQIGKLRWAEIKTIRNSAYVTGSFHPLFAINRVSSGSVARSLLIALVTAIPVLASILSFVSVRPPFFQSIYD